MSNLQEFKRLFSTDVKVVCADGVTLSGFWSEWFSAEDNGWDEDAAPRGESILIDTDDGEPIEIYVAEIERIESIKK